MYQAITRGIVALEIFCVPLEYSHLFCTGGNNRQPTTRTALHNVGFVQLYHDAYATDSECTITTVDFWNMLARILQLLKRGYRKLFPPPLVKADRDVRWSSRS